MTRIRAGVGVKLERLRCRLKRVRELPFLQGHGGIAPRRHRPSVAVGQRQRDVLQIEAPGDRTGQVGHSVRSCGHHEHVPTQVKQARQLIAAPQRLLGSCASHVRQPAGDEAHCQEHKEGDPVLWIRDRPGANRGQEEEVERQHRRDRGDDRHPKP